MVRTPSIDKNGIKRGAWSEEEDNKLRAYVKRFGHSNWRQLPKYAGLMRCGKSCRLRWMNYLRPGLKKGNYNHEEEELIIKLHKELGNRWSAIATKLPGRSDNDVKNHWHAHLKKRVTMDQQLTDQSSQSAGSQTSNKISECETTIGEMTYLSAETSRPLDDSSSDHDLYSNSSSHLNGLDWIEEDNYMRSMEQFSSTNSLEPLPDSFSWPINSTDNLQTEPNFDHFWTQPSDNFWTQPFF
ncbi:unnamed protein product [Withania somnifera]